MDDCYGDANFSKEKYYIVIKRRKNIVLNCKNFKNLLF